MDEFKFGDEVVKEIEKHFTKSDNKAAELEIKSIKVEKLKDKSNYDFVSKECNENRSKINELVDEVNKLKEGR